MQSQQFHSLPINTWFMFGSSELLKVSPCSARAGRVLIPMLGEDSVQRIERPGKK